MNRLLVLSVLGVSAIAALALPVSASSGRSETPAQDQKDGRKCLNLPAIERTYVINDYVLVYATRGGGLYRNTFARRCDGLERYRAFTTEVTSPFRLCRGDTVNVSLTRTNCILGAFNPISDMDFKRLQYAAHLQREAQKKKEKGDD